MMKRKKRIEKILNINFPEYKLTINDISMLHKGHNNIDGNQETHFSIILNANYKKKESSLILHRKINKILKKEFAEGLHALEIKIIN